MNTIDDVLEACNSALEDLKAARSKLGTASLFGVFDILGGGFFSGFIKHSRMSKARKLIRSATAKLANIRKEVANTPLHNINLKTMDFIGMTDLFFDNLLSDILMQSRISKAKGKLDRVIKELSNSLADLRELQKLEKAEEKRMLE